MCTPGLHLSLGIFNRLWTLLEDACKSIDFKCAVEGSGAGFSDDDVCDLNRLSRLKQELSTQRGYANLLSEMLTYSILTLGSEDIRTLVANLKDEITATQESIANKVTLN